MDGASFGVWWCRHRLVCDSGGREGRRLWWKGKGQAVPSLSLSPSANPPLQPQSACPAWSHRPSKACTPAYNASNLWRSCTAIDSPAKCMVLCHVMATAYAKPVCVHNVCRQTAWLCIVGQAITFLLAAFFCNPHPAYLVLALNRRWWKRTSP